jgi:hypothetical protein
MRAVYKRNHIFVSDTVVPDAVIEALAELPALIDRWRETAQYGHRGGREGSAGKP